MLHTIWVVVKIILMVLAILLGTVLLILAGLLLLPFGYRIRAEGEEAWTFKLRISWLHWILSGKVLCENEEFFWKVSLFGIPLAAGGQKQKKEAETENTKKPEKKNTDYNINTEKNRETKKDTGSRKNTKKEKKQKETTEPEKKQKADWKGIFTKIKKTWHTTKDRKEILVSDFAKEAFSACKTEIIRILKKIRPRSIKGCLEFGTGDPAGTGQILGILSVAYVLINHKIRIYPDFERKVLRGDVTVRGRIPLGAVLLSLFRIYKNRNLRLLKRKIEDAGGKKDERE